MNDVTSKNSDTRINPSSSWTILSDCVESQVPEECRDVEIIRLHENNLFEERHCDKSTEECARDVKFSQMRRKDRNKRHDRQIRTVCIVGTILALLSAFFLSLSIAKVRPTIKETGTKLSVVRDYLTPLQQKNDTYAFNSKDPSMNTCPNLKYGPRNIDEHLKLIRKTIPSEGQQKLRKLTPSPVDMKSQKTRFVPDLSTKGLVLTKETLKHLLNSLYFANVCITVQEIILAVLIVHLLFKTLRDAQRRLSMERRLNTLKKIRQTLIENQENSFSQLNQLTSSPSRTRDTQQCSVLKKSNQKQSDYLGKLKRQHEERMKILRSNRQRQQRSIEALISKQKSKNTLNDDLQLDYTNTKKSCYEFLSVYWRKREKYLIKKLKFLDKMFNTVKAITEQISKTSSTLEQRKYAILVFPECKKLKNLRSTISLTSLNCNTSSVDFVAGSSDGEDKRRPEADDVIKNNATYTILFGRRGDEIRKRDISFWVRNAYSRKVNEQSQSGRPKRRSRHSKRHVKR